MTSYIDKVTDISHELNKDRGMGGGICIWINPHFAYCETPEEYIKECEKNSACLSKEQELIAKKYNEHNKMVSIQFYLSPSGFLMTYGLTLEGSAKDIIDQLIQHDIIDKSSYKIIGKQHDQ